MRPRESIREDTSWLGRRYQEWDQRAAVFKIRLLIIDFILEINGRIRSQGPPAVSSG
jgi:hypothetical protein